MNHLYCEEIFMIDYPKSYLLFKMAVNYLLS